MSGNEITETPRRPTTTSTHEDFDRNCRKTLGDLVGPIPGCSSDCAILADELLVDTEPETVKNASNIPHPSTALEEHIHVASVNDSHAGNVIELSEARLDT